LYLTLLGVCGTDTDVAELETMIRKDDRQLRSALDALVACYLNLRGADGLPLIEDLFLKNSKAEYTDTYATIMALRFHGQETNVVPRDRLAAALRLMLDRPQLADLVIPDLARWEDWSVMDRLVELFKTADDESIWVRVPVINYLRACPLPEAKQHIDELAKIDPDAVKRASNFFPLGSAVKPPKGAERPKDSTPAAKSEDETNAEDADRPLDETLDETPDAGDERASNDASSPDVAIPAEATQANDAAIIQDAATVDQEVPATAPMPAPEEGADFVPPANETKPGLGLVFPVSLGAAVALFIVMMVILRGGAPRSTGAPRNA
jgi:hypothetical protein